MFEARAGFASESTWTRSFPIQPINNQLGGPANTELAFWLNEAHVNLIVLNAPSLYPPALLGLGYSVGARFPVG